MLEAVHSMDTAVKQAKTVSIQSKKAVWEEYLEKRREADICWEKEVQKAEAACADSILAERNKLKKARQALQAGQLDVRERRTELEKVYISQQQVVCQLTRLLNSADQVCT